MYKQDTNRLCFDLLQHLPAKSQTPLDLRNCQRWIQSFRTRPRAVENSMAPVQTHAVVQRILALLCLLISAIRDPAVGLEEYCRAEVLFAVPPVRRAGCAAAGAENAF